MHKILTRVRLVGLPGRHVWIGQRIEMTPDDREGFIPADRDVMIRRRVVGHRVGQTPNHLQLIVAPSRKLRNAVSRKKFRRAAFCGRFPCDGLGAVLAELE